MLQIDIDDYLKQDEKRYIQMPKSTKSQLKQLQRQQDPLLVESPFAIKYNIITFPKEERFRTTKPYLVKETPLNITSHIQSPSFSIGHSTRSHFYYSTVRKASQLPGPFDYFKDDRIKVSCYKCDDHLNKSIPAPRYAKGYTFPNSYEKYKKQCSFDLKIFHNESNPGIGTYQVNLEPVRRKPQRCLILPRREFLDTSATINLSPTSYQPKYTQVLSHRNKSPSLGTGRKMNIAKPLNDNPGPGSYFGGPLSVTSPNNTSRECTVSYRDNMQTSESDGKRIKFKLKEIKKNMSVH